MALFNLNGFTQLGKPSGFAAGDEHLTGNDLVQHKILPSLIQLRQNIVQQQHRLLAPFSCHQLPLGQLQTNGRRAGLTLRSVGFQIDSRKGNIKIILVGAGQALTGFDFRPIMAL